jgi:hypothetical protein
MSSAPRRLVAGDQRDDDPAGVEGTGQRTERSKVIPETSAKRRLSEIEMED